MIHHGERLKEIIRESGLTDNVLAEKLGMSRGGVQNMYLRPKVKPQQLLEVAKVLGISLELIEQRLGNHDEYHGNVQSKIDVYLDIKHIYEHRLKDKDVIIQLLKEKIQWLESRLGN
jgi:transcriptional regulator with XRE-family HTH domain